jgi:hypothetical protein
MLYLEVRCRNSRWLLCVLEQGFRGLTIEHGRDCITSGTLIAYDLV